jgi:hypothetical protein
MTNIYIKTTTEQLSFIDGGGSFGWRSNNKFTVHDAKLTGEPGGFCTVVDVSVGDTIYVLTVEYTGGGCEGCAYGIGEILMVFTSKETAFKAMEEFKTVIDEIENHDYDEDSEDKPYIPQDYVTIELEDGTQINVYNPVNDYNATLDYKLKVIERIVK